MWKIDNNVKSKCDVCGVNFYCKELTDRHSCLNFKEMFFLKKYKTGLIYYAPLRKQLKKRF